MSRSLVVEISALVADTSMCPAIFAKICKHRETRFSLARYSGSSMGSVGVLPATFLVVSGKKLH